MDFIWSSQNFVAFSEYMNFTILIMEIVMILTLLFSNLFSYQCSFVKNYPNLPKLFFVEEYHFRGTFFENFNV